ncbi:MAG: hypothetical protein RBR97_18350 [Bacteroidales bacterium]|nr:hypothetical protein [Bacteroidales bacterium]
MKNKDLAREILKSLPKKNRKKPKLDTYDKLSEKEREKVDKISKRLLSQLDNKDTSEETNNS